MIHSRAVFLHFLNPGVRTRFVKTFGRNPRTVFRAEESLFDAGLEIQKSFKRVISRKESYQQDISISKAQSKTFGLRTFVQNPDIIQCFLNEYVANMEQLRGLKIIGRLFLPCLQVFGLLRLQMYVYIYIYRYTCMICMIFVYYVFCIDDRH